MSIGKELEREVTELRELRRALQNKCEKYAAPPSASHSRGLPLTMPSFIRIAIRQLQRGKPFYTSRHAEKHIREALAAYAAQYDRDVQQIREQREFQDEFGHLCPGD